MQLKRFYDIRYQQKEETVMSNDVTHSEEDFINKLIANKVPVSVFMRNGIKLTGILVAADSDVLYLKNTITQMIYKHAVSTIVPGGTVE